MKIPDPVVRYGQACSVLNYRRKPAEWVGGKCCGLAYDASFGGSFRWSYRVEVQTLSGTRLVVSVGDADIRKAREL